MLCHFYCKKKKKNSQAKLDYVQNMKRRRNFRGWFNFFKEIFCQQKKKIALCVIIYYAFYANSHYNF